MFPHGAPGLALLLLRLSVAATFLISANRFGVSSVYWLFGAVLLICISLSIGFLTPILSVVVCIAASAVALISASPGNLLCIFCAFDAAALALLGPGAYSLDARLFGRRVTVVTPRKDRNRT
jgi:uncharacterized membrane protein YphA (DoxX/SURF4 family)